MGRDIGRDLVKGMNAGHGRDYLCSLCHRVKLWVGPACNPGGYWQGRPTFFLADAPYARLVLSPEQEPENIADLVIAVMRPLQPKKKDNIFTKKVYAFCD